MHLLGAVLGGRRSDSRAGRIPAIRGGQVTTLRQDLGTQQMQSSLQNTAAEAAGVKALFSSLMSIFGLVVGSFDLVVWGVIGLWAIDMITGTLHAIDTGGWKGLEVGKARSGFFRVVILLCAVASVALAADVLARMGGPSLVPMAVWFVCGWVAYSEMLSIGRHVEHFYPGLGGIVGKVAGLLRHRAESERAKIPEPPAKAGE